jgi:hypothetical protein
VLENKILIMFGHEGDEEKTVEETAKRRAS